MVKPVIKWVGGKTQIINTLLEHFPENINNYHEPFLGGGSVLLALIASKRISGKIYASDLNEALVYVYKNIQTKHHELYTELEQIIKRFTVSTDKEAFYYQIREQYNLSDKKNITGSCLFIFLNKTCFRGLYRTGPRGFNVPYGHYKNPEIINKKHLEEVHNLIQGVIFECCDFTESLKRVQPTDFVYLDPPYVPESKTSNYTHMGFKEHQLLFDLVKKMNSFILSNSDTPLVRDNFIEYQILTIVCKRSINAKKPNSKTNELIIFK